MLSHDLLLWGESTEALRRLRRISVFNIVAGYCSSGSGERWPIPDLLGFAYFIEGNEESSKYVGTFGPVPCQTPEWKEEGWYSAAKWTAEDGKPIKPLNPSDLNLRQKIPHFDEKHMLHFDVDGPEGEEVTEVHVSMDFKAVKLKTNRGKECYWGEERRDQWHSRIAGDEEYIAGLSVCFGRLGGYSWRAKMYSHWRLSEVGVVLARRDGGTWGRQ